MDKEAQQMIGFAFILLALFSPLIALIACSGSASTGSIIERNYKTCIENSKDPDKCKDLLK